MIEEIIICDRCGKKISKDQKLKYHVTLAPYSDDFGNVISKGRPIDLCEACDLDLDNFIRSFKAKEYERPKYPPKDFGNPVVTSVYAAPSVYPYSTSTTLKYISKEGSDSDGNST